MRINAYVPRDCHVTTSVAIDHIVQQPICCQGLLRNHPSVAMDHIIVTYPLLSCHGSHHCHVTTPLLPWITSLSCNHPSVAMDHIIVTLPPLCCHGSHLHARQGPRIMVDGWRGWRRVVWGRRGPTGPPVWRVAIGWHVVAVDR